MAIKAPSTGQIVEVGAELGMRLSEDEAAQYLAAMKPLLDGYDTVDATIVSRILDEGGEIVGKTACEYLCFSGGSHTNATALPVGHMLVGKHFDEATVYRAAHAYEQSVDWKTL